MQETREKKGREGIFTELLVGASHTSYFISSSQKHYPHFHRRGHWDVRRQSWDSNLAVWSAASLEWKHHEGRRTGSGCNKHGYCASLSASPAQTLSAGPHGGTRRQRGGAHGSFRCAKEATEVSEAPFVCKVGWGRQVTGRGSSPQRAWGPAMKSCPVGGRR